MQHAINGVQMHWREAGTGDPLILLHGFPFNCELWEPQLNAVPDGWWYIAPDLRGFGKSEDSGSDALTMDRHADDILALMDHLGIDQAVIGGLSMGGYVALSLIMRYPDRVRALVLAATRASADSEEARRNRLEQAATVRKSGIKVVVDSMLPKLFSAHSKMKVPETVTRVRKMMDGTSAETMARALEGMAQRKDYSADLPNIGVSTLVLRGEQDEIIPAGDMEAIARTVRGARHEVISLAGHLPNVEAPDVFNKILTHYVTMLPPALKLGDLSLSF